MVRNHLMLLAVGLTVGCTQTETKQKADLPEVVVAQPLQQQVTDFADYTGRTEAPESVDVRSRVTGYIVKVAFKEGAEVKKDDLLFVVDPRPYDEELKLALSQVEVAKARAQRTTKDLARADEQKKTPGVISAQEYDKYVADKLEADATLHAAEAAVGSKRLNVEFTRITAPINGRVGKINLTVGNLVSADNNLLTSIVSQDPIYVYFDIDEPTILRIQELVRQGKFRSARNNNDVPVFIGLSTETDNPHPAMISFVDNKVDATTGTLKVRATLQNPIVQETRRFAPGLFVKVRVPLGEPQNALLVSERALGSDQGQKYVYVVNKEGGKNVVEYRPVQIGPAQKGGLRVVFPVKLVRGKDGIRMAKPDEKGPIEDSIKATDWVIVNGLQRARPGLEVKTTEIPMPSQLPLLESKEVKTASPENADKAKSATP